MNNNSIFSKTFLVMLTLVLISKGIIILDEEILVLIAFLIFFMAIYLNGRDAVAEDLDNRAAKINTEFETYFNARKETLKSLITYYKKSSALVNEISKLFTSLQLQINEINTKKRDALDNTISSYINNKLKNILIKEFTVLQQLQLAISSNFYNTIKKQFASNLNFNNLVNQSIKSLNTIEKITLTIAGKKKAVSLLGLPLLQK